MEASVPRAGVAAWRAGSRTDPGCGRCQLLFCSTNTSSQPPKGRLVPSYNRYLWVCEECLSTDVPLGCLSAVPDAVTASFCARSPGQRVSKYQNLNDVSFYSALNNFYICKGNTLTPKGILFLYPAENKLFLQPQSHTELVALKKWMAEHRNSSCISIPGCDPFSNNSLELSWLIPHHVSTETINPTCDCLMAGPLWLKYQSKIGLCIQVLFPPVSWWWLDWHMNRVH